MGFLSSSLLLLLLLLFSLLPLTTTADSPPSPSLPSSEQEAAYHALSSIDPSVDWRSLYPDDLCLSGPHGLVCDLLPTSNGSTLAPHIVELNFGFVSDFSANPDCGPHASLPLSISSLPFLRRLFFYNCFTGAQTPLSTAFLASAPDSLQDLIFLDNPSLVGRLSGHVGSPGHLRRLILSGTAVSGSIPKEIGDLPSLDQLVLSRNRLRGPIPSELGRAGSLKILDLSGNRLGGTIPAQIGRLTELYKLDLSSNRLAGSVPSQLAGLKKLEFLDLGYNRLTGGVPTALAEMTSLKEVCLSGNRLGGTIPEIWEKMGGVLGIGMSGLGLTGNIPASMGVFLERLCYLALDNNFLDGELPDQFKGLERSAREINLENNGLQGRIPFSAQFVGSVGGKLKVGGNPKLCVGRELVGHVRGKGSVGDLGICNNTEIPHPVLLPTSCGLSSKMTGPVFGLWVAVFALFFIF